MEIDQFQLEIPQYINNASLVKELVLQRLRMDNIITIQQEEEYSEKWQIIIIKRGWFKSWFKKFFNNDDKDSYQYKFVKFEE